MALGEAPSGSLPQGVVTFLLTDIEGSSQLWERDPDAMEVAISLHDRVLETAVADAGGVRPVEQGEGDSVVVAFAHASQALACALELQRGLAAAEWPGGCELQLRVAIHTGEPVLRDGRNYVGPALNRCARLRTIAHGGQTLVSRATYELVAESLPKGASLRPLGPQRLRDLERAEEVFELAHPELPSGFPLPQSLEAAPNNLPAQLSSFIGRERELADVAQLLADNRLVTLVGAGGCGKTRLALQTASETLARFPDGAWWVELAPVSDERLVGAAIAEALGVRPLPGMTALQAAGAYLAARRALVILDNCEHLADACAEAAEALLQAAADVVVMATSRAAIGARGERDWRVPSMSLPTPEGNGAADPQPGSDAVALFVARASAARPEFDFDAQHAEAVSEICTELDGLPLGIELAAARLRMLSLDQIATGLSDRFRLLTGGPRTETPRLKTLRASVDWSYELLADAERALLRRLAVFAGGFTLEAIEEVCAGEGIEPDEALDRLTALVDQSLVIAEGTGAAFRYRLLETVRQYGLERLLEAGEEQAIRGRHRDYFLALAEQCAPHLETSRQGEWFKVLDPEAANLAAATEFALQDDPSRALRIATALNRWWCARGRFAEAELAYSRSLEAGCENETALRARGFERRAWVATYKGDYETAEAHATEALALAEEAGDAATAARARCELGAPMVFRDPRAGRAELERAAELAGAAGDKWALIEATQLIAWSHLQQADHAACARVGEEVAALAERQGESYQAARPWFFVSWMGQVDGRLAEARDAAERMRAAVESAGEPWNEATADVMEAWVDVWEGEAERALRCLHPRLERTLRLGVGAIVPTLLVAIAFAELALGRLNEARSRLEVLVPLIEGRDGVTTALALRMLAEVERMLSDDGAESTAVRAQASAEDVGNHAIVALVGLTLGRLAAARGEFGAAQQHAMAFLDACVEGGHATYVPSCLDALGEVAAGVDQHEDAVRLFAAAERARAEIGIVRVPPEEEHWAAIDARLRESLGNEAYEAARARGAELTTEDALEWARRGRGARKRPPGGWDSLTPTERKVVDLVAEGLTNPQIAERMFISRETVKTHLAHVYRKLSVRNRAELSASAAARDSANG